jgi:hypothetical protein
MSASRFQWTDSGAQSFITDVHVQNQVPEKVRSLFPARSLDQTVVEVVSVGSGVNQVSILIVAERDDTGLRDFQDAAKRGISITYTPDNAGAPGTTYTVTAVAVGEIRLDRRGRQDLFTLPLTLARLDGGAFAPDI